MLSQHSKNETFRLNADFLEANVINIAILFFALAYLLKQFLGALLKTRRRKVLASIQESEERLQKANIRLIESEKQVKQASIVIKQIEQEAIVTAAKVRQFILDQGKLDIERLTEAGKVSIAIAERQVIKQIQQQITDLAVMQVGQDLKKQITSSAQAKIIDENIMQLGDSL
jgi:F0F1-type ATP synthase membrane subunit b/b'